MYRMALLSIVVDNCTINVDIYILTYKLTKNVEGAQ